MKVVIELLGASRDISYKNSIEFDIKNNSTIKDFREEILDYIDLHLKGNKNYIKIVNSSAYC